MSTLWCASLNQRRRMPQAGIGVVKPCQWSRDVGYLVDNSGGIGRLFPLLFCGRHGIFFHALVRLGDDFKFISSQVFISSTVHPPIHQNTLEFLELSDYILQYIAQIHVPCLPPHPQKDDCWWSFRSPNYPLLTSWEWPGLAKEELQKMEDRARRGEKETVRKPLEWLDPLFSGKILLLRKNQECGSFHWG